MPQDGQTGQSCAGRPRALPQPTHGILRSFNHGSPLRPCCCSCPCSRNPKPWPQPCSHHCQPCRHHLCCHRHPCRHPCCHPCRHPFRHHLCCHRHPCPWARAWEQQCTLPRPLLPLAQGGVAEGTPSATLPLLGLRVAFLGGESERGGARSLDQARACGASNCSSHLLNPQGWSAATALLLYPLGKM